MKRSTDRILTTHVGSLPRPGDLRAMWSKKTGTAADEAALQARLRSAVSEVVLAQKRDRSRYSERWRVRQAHARGHGPRRLGQLHLRPRLRLQSNLAAIHRTGHRRPWSSNAHRRGALGATRICGVLHGHGARRAKHRSQTPDLQWPHCLHRLRVSARSTREFESSRRGRRHRRSI